MKTQSAKAKGRLLQQHIAACLAELFEDMGLQPGDFRSVSMGASGEDVILSPAAKATVGDLRIEAKNRETLNVTTVFYEHANKYKGKPVILVHKRNHTKPLVTLTLPYFLELLKSNAKKVVTNADTAPTQS